MKNVKKDVGRIKVLFIYYNGSSKQRRPQRWDSYGIYYKLMTVTEKKSVCISLLTIQKVCWYFSLPILNFTNDESEHKDRRIRYFKSRFGLRWQWRLSGETIILN